MAERLSDETLADIIRYFDRVRPNYAGYAGELARELQEARAVIRDVLPWFEEDYEPANSEDAYRWWACADALRAMLPEETEA